MTTYNQTIFAVSATTDFPVVKKKIYLNRSVTSSSSGSFAVRVGLIKSVTGPSTITVNKEPTKILSVLAASLLFIDLIKSLSHIIKYTVTSIPVVAYLLSKVLSVSSSVNRYLVKYVSFHMAITSSPTVTIVKDGIKYLYVNISSAPKFIRSLDMPSLFNLVTQEPSSNLYKTPTKTVSASASSTPTIRKSIGKKILATLSSTASLIKNPLVTLFVVSQTYLYNTLGLNLSAILYVAATSEIALIRQCNLILNLVSTIIVEITKIPELIFSVTSATTSTVRKTFYFYSAMLVESPVISRLTKVLSLTQSLVVACEAVGILSTVSTIIQTFLVTLHAITESSPVISLTSSIAVIYYQTIELTANLTVSLLKTSNKVLSVTVSNILKFIRSWG